MQRQINMKQVPNKKGKGNRQTFFSDLQQFHKLVFQKSYGQRKQKKEKGNTCVRNEKTRREREKRDNR